MIKHAPEMNCSLGKLVVGNPVASVPGCWYRVHAEFLPDAQSSSALLCLSADAVRGG